MLKLPGNPVSFPVKISRQPILSSLSLRLLLTTLHAWCYYNQSVDSIIPDAGLIPQKNPNYFFNINPDKPG
jgi:hypothetical protein